MFQTVAHPRGSPPAWNATQTDLDKTVITRAMLQRRVGALAAEITSDFQSQEILLVPILKGALFFACDLLRYLRLPVRMDFLSVPKYLSDAKPPFGITSGLASDISGRHVLLVEDIVDTGLSLNALIQELAKERPRSLSICTLLERPGMRLAEVPLRYVGFRVEEDFLVGYGLDFRDRYRSLPFIATIKSGGASVVPA